MDRPWHNHYPPGVPHTIEYPEIPLYNFLQDSARIFPQRDALVFYDGPAGRELATKTYAQLEDESSSFATALMCLGIGVGDRVAYFMPNCPDLVVGFYGILKAGAVPVPCNPMYKDQELGHQLEDSGARAILCEPDLLSLVQQVAPRTVLEHVVVTGFTAAQGGLTMGDLIESHQPPSSLPTLNPRQDLALLPYTGGTTGVPKGTMLTHHNLVVDVLQFKNWFQYREGAEVFVAALPLFHIGGIAGVMNVPLAVGATMILFNRFDPVGVAKVIQEYSVTRFLGVPTMYIAILNHESAKSFDFSTLRASRTSAAPLPEAVKEAFDNRVGHEVLIEGYGLTETSPLTHVNPTQRAIAGSIGVPLPGTEARIVDADGGVEELPVGAIGEIIIKGPQVMRGYWNKPEATSEAVRNGWLYTGDLARMDEHGYFFIVDRKKDVINAAGFKVWPREVEEVLYQHPFVRAAAVIGVPDSYRGETVKAVVVLKDGHGFASDAQAEREIAGYCRDELASYKVPRIVELRSELPVSAAGKVLRRVLRDLDSG